MNKRIEFCPDGENETVGFFVVEETRIAGVSYLLVTESEDDEEAEAYILKDLSEDGETEARYVFVEDDQELESYLWPIVREIIKTAIENRQDLIVEGCYVPPRWSQDFTPSYLREIRFCCLVMTKAYIETHFADIQKYACAAERRIDDSTCTKETLLLDNAHYQQMCETWGYPCILIDQAYEVDIPL